MLQTVLMWLYPLLLIVPCIALDITEIHYSVLAKAVNVLLPSGVYLVLMSAWSRPGRMAVFLLPVAVLCAFQIVLLFLYGESIIAIDMFLNVVTTNYHEATELLRNLTVAIIVVCVMYLPPLIAGIVLWCRGSRLVKSYRRPACISGGILIAAGGICAGVAVLMPAGYKPERELFPVNVISNMFSAAERTVQTKEYFNTSADFSFDVNSDTIDCNSSPRLFILVIGETSRADNWQLNGYERPTNPRLSKRDGIVFCPKTISESNTTHKSVPLLMSHLDAAAFADSIYRTKSVIEAFNEAGYATVWLSNQQRNGSIIDFFGEEADSTFFLTDDGREHHDNELCALLQHFIASHPSEKLFAVLHTYGSHFNYKERYPAGYNVFTPDNSVEASAGNRPSLINAYDNTILYTDAVLDSIISTADAAGCPAAMIYLADHGEDIYDDSRLRFLHASPTPTYWQIHVPMLLWMSDSYRDEHPEKYLAALQNSRKNVSSSRSAFHTLMSLADVKSPCVKLRAALTEKTYQEPQRVYLNDYNEAVPLNHCGLREPDYAMLQKRGIKY